MHPWSPFTCLPAASLTPSGLLQLDVQDQEVELVRRGPLELRWEGGDGTEPMAPCPPTAHGPWKSRHSSLILTITTHRLVFSTSAQQSPQARFVHLSNVHQIQATGGPTLLHPNASHKLVVSTYTYGDFVLCLSSGNAKADRDSLEQHLTKALGRKQWEMATRLQEQQLQQHTMTRRRVGVDHILTKNKLKHQQAQKVAQDALSGDAEQLLQQASALLQVIQNYTSLLQNHKQQNEDDEDAEKLSSLLQDMGMTSALTKDHFSGGKRKGADRDYYEWLARQVVDFMWTRLPQMGGVASLTDVYCLLNRARGTNLVSPEDLRQACDLLGELNLGISQRIFDSGIVVLQMDNHGNDQKFQTLVDLCPTTALEASHTLKVSPLLALEQLKEAEQAGWLCRDVTLETTRFYPNLFDKFAIPSK